MSDEEEFSTDALKLVNIDSNRAQEHLVCEILSWGLMDPRQTFPLPGAILIGWSSVKLSANPNVRLMVDWLSDPAMRPNPIETKMKLHNSVIYRLVLRPGDPMTSKPHVAGALKFSSAPGWREFGIGVMAELADCYLGNSQAAKTLNSTLDDLNAAIKRLGK